MLNKFRLYLKLDLGLSEKTIEAYSQDLKDFLIKYPSPEVSRIEIQEYLDGLQKKELTNRSIARKLSTLRCYFKFQMLSGNVEHDPTDQIETPKIGKTLPKTLSQDEVKLLLNEPKNPTDLVLLRTLYATGLRVSELISMKPENADLTSGIIRIQGKGGKIRIVPVDEDTLKSIKHYLNFIRPELLKKSQQKPAKKKTALFLSSHGTDFTRQGFWKLIKKYAKQAGIEASVSPHVLRHAFATHLLENGMGLRTLQMLLGHTDISTTEIYSHVTSTHLHEAVAKYHPRAKRAR